MRVRVSAAMLPGHAGEKDGRAPSAQMPSTRLQFHPIDLGRHGALAVEFRRDSYICSFGDDRIFAEENGADGRGYIEWLEARLQHFPEGHVHAWQDDVIVGQVEMIIGARGGYVNLFYLRPESRGCGLGDALHDYVVALLARHRIGIAGLSVSPTNKRAVRYYERHGWRDAGPRPGAPYVHEMQLVILEQ